MGAKLTSVRRDPGYAGLTESAQALPASWYFDPAHHQRELRQIWHRSWIYACRASEIREPRAYRIFDLGDQSIIAVRGDDGVARAFHNTCRHRGAALCREPEGRFPAAGIICPYHSWTYDLCGALLRTTSKYPADDFEPSNYPLYPVAVREWNGFIYLCLAADPPPFGEPFDQPVNRFDTWHMADLVVAHTFRKVIACNWKIFWENYNECLHCPAVHPRLAQLVPLFGRALQDPKDDPHWHDHAADDDPKYRGGLRTGAQSWSMDGNPTGIPFPDLSDEDRQAGHTYMTCLPSAFIVGHVDYVRVVRLRPLGPEQTELTVEFLFLPQTLADKCDIQSAIDFTTLVMTEDAQVCELNQRGLRAAPHAGGVVMPEEYMILNFQNWVRAQLQQV